MDKNLAYGCFNGNVWLDYVQVSLASDFMYNLANREATASMGYDYLLRQVAILELNQQLLERILCGFAN